MGAPYPSKISSGIVGRLFYDGVEFGKKLFEVFAVSVRSLRHRLTVRESAPETMHSVREKYLRRVGIDLDKIAYQSIGRDFVFHNILLITT